MFRLYFGVPGCGKTTLACRNLVKKQKSRKNTYDHFYSNFPNTCSQTVSLTGLGQWTFPFNSYLVIDEAGITYNNRKFKSLPQETIEWFKLHRHYGVDVDFISQSWDDIDITIRRLVDEIWYIKKLGPFTMEKRIFKRIEINEETSQIIDGYKFGKMFPFFFNRLIYGVRIRIFLRRPYYKYFDTYDAPKLPIRYGSSPQGED